MGGALINSVRIVNGANLALAVLLLTLLVLKELTDGVSERWHRLNRLLPFGIIPLMIAFLITVAVKVVQYLGLAFHGLG